MTHHVFPLLLLVASVSTFDETWDLDGPCQEYVQRLANAQARMTQCAINYSTPPKVCTNCIDEYINFKQIEYDTRHLDEVTSLDNTTCASVIYGNYLMSYSHEISTALTTNIWEKSRCSSCLEINWDFQDHNSTIRYDEKTIQFQEVLFKWRDCVTNYSDTGSLLYGNASTICDECGQTYENLFDFYWKIYTEPSIDFCIDVETTMNDTTHLWANVWKCPEDTHIGRHSDALMLMIAVTVLIIMLTLFYGGSYIQTERAEQNLIRYSRLEAPRGPRSRLVSSSSFFSSPGASVVTAVSAHS
uniref:Transmembrane protein n=1 Tax=Panagrellus redivivus TaxID=6233 RepID=A0A7E4UM88_PANRE